MHSNTLCAAFQRTAHRDPTGVALRTPGDAQTLTWAEYAGQVEQVAAALAAHGIGRGDTVALMMGNRIEFYPLEVGAQHVGATSFSAYNTLPPEQLRYVFDNAGNRVLFCEEAYVDRVIASGTTIETIVCIDGSPAGTISLQDFLTRAEPGFDFEATWKSVQPDDILTLIYTSGTTGNPKGVEITHAAMLFTARAAHSVAGFDRADRVISYLPSAHIADRFTSCYVQEVYGSQITTVSDIAGVAAALPDVRPTIFGAVPRVWDKLRIAVETSPERIEDEQLRRAVEWGLGVATRRGEYALRGKDMDPEFSEEWERADAAVLSGLRARLGLDAVRWAVSGGAPVAPETVAFFAGLGVPIGQNWGMSELGALASASRPGEICIDTVGRLLPGVEAKVAEDGELLIRGPLLMKGYRKEPAKTAEAIDEDGWLHTGDIATVDDDGLVRIAGRKKDIIINAAGKNMSPSNIENAVKGSCPLIGSVVAIGDARPFVTALIVLDPEAAGAAALRSGLTEWDGKALANDPEIVEKLRRGVAAGNTKLARVEQIKRFVILPKFWEPGGDEMTMTMKVKRAAVLENYAELIDTLYAPQVLSEVYEPA
ncbi:AMP-binding protein [Mycolicibacterium austroafricanum]|nr:AMP-binding protein [Mycolicibacterium austroafricanum]QZY47019.1 long-chain fatty acid--CoA ligase [Mycolicibacterium austroafricanum]